jgi:hypothetical protein
LRNDEPVDPGAWNKPLPVDGGTYQITARAPGNTDWSSTIAVGVEHDAWAIEIPRLKAAALQPLSATGPASPSQQPSKPLPRAKALSLAFGGAALGLVGGAVGFELWARSTYDTSRREPDHARQDSLWHSASTRRYVAEGLGVAGIACAGVSVWFYLRGGEPEATATHPQASRLIVEPILGSDRAGLVLMGRY